MKRYLKTHRYGCIIFLLAMVVATPPTFKVESGYTVRAQDTQRDKEGQADEKKANRRVLSAGEVKGDPVLWKEPGKIANRDLFYGVGGKENAPDLSDVFTFMGQDKNGTSKKIYVRDSAGHEWIVKFGREARPETAATRIVWAVGYHVDPDYFVKSVRIEDEKGGFEARDVRFKLRHAGYKTEGLWRWEVNPFLGTRELDGLKVLMALLNNWDLKVLNNKVVRPDKENGEPGEAIYYVSDLGATFGTTGAVARKLFRFANPPAGSKGDPGGYARQAFIDGVNKDGTIIFHYKGKDSSALRGIPVIHALWMGNLLGQLSDKQLSDAFRAAGWDDEDVATLTGALRRRIQQLQALR